MDRSNFRAVLRVVAAFAVAPWVPTLAAVSLWPTRDAFRFSLAIAYAVTLIIGIPAYALFQEHAELSRRRVLRVSGWTGFATALVASANPLIAILFGVPLGLSAGITFWLIWYRRSDVRART